MKNNNSKIKIALGMSGGVDSSLCAHLLVEQGYDVTGVYLECWRAPGCRSEEDRKDALKIALELGIPFKVLDFKKAYKDKVVEYFFKEYEKGLTPNPDVMCNKEIKFGLFYDLAMDEGFDFIATGHYAKISKLETELNQKTNNLSQNQLCVPKDTHKDQTYFLYLMNQDQVDHTLFPLENLNKTEVREEAEKRGLHVSNKKDSVGICFIGDINVHEFLKERLGENPGDVVDTTGNIIGSHKGLWFYTVGQRSGFEIKSKTLIKQDDGSSISKHNIPPFYVIRKNPEKNQLVVGFGGETLNDGFGVRDLHWIVEGNEMLAQNSDHLFVRIRHTGELLKCELNKTDSKAANDENSHQVKLEKAIQGIAEGQSAVFYLSPRGGYLNHKEYKKNDNQTICLGGGIISS